MQSLFNLLLIFHIIGGTLGLISGTAATILQKGSKWHKRTGKVYFWSMFFASIAALVISNLPQHHNIFLFAVGGFTLYMICSGYRIVYVKRERKNWPKPFSAIDYSITAFAILFGIFLIYLSITSIIRGNMFGTVPGVFGLISLNYARLDYRMLFNKVALSKAWMPNHISRMMGALIATYTAFLVVNIRFKPEFVLWLLPSVIGAVLIFYFLRKFAPKKA